MERIKGVVFINRHQTKNRIKYKKKGLSGLEKVEIFGTSVRNGEAEKTGVCSSIGIHLVNGAR